MHGKYIIIIIQCNYIMWCMFNIRPGIYDHVPDTDYGVLSRVHS